MNAYEIDALVTGLRKTHGSSDPFILAGNEGFKLFYKELGGLLGFYCSVLGTGVICLNNRIDDDVARMVAAHELGHGLLHSGTDAGSICPDYSLWSSKSRTEYEANAFAAHLLIPTEKLLSRLDELACDPGSTGDTPASLAAYFSCDENLLLIKIKELRRMGKRLKLPIDPDHMFLRSR